jgi:hypothetical protein
MNYAARDWAISIAMVATAMLVLGSLLGQFGYIAGAVIGFFVVATRHDVFGRALFYLMMLIFFLGFVAILLFNLLFVAMVWN